MTTDTTPPPPFPADVPHEYTADVIAYARAYAEQETKALRDLLREAWYQIRDRDLRIRVDAAIEAIDGALKGKP